MSDDTSSFVYVAGWCYRIESAEQGPTSDDCREMLERHRLGLSPVGEGFSGNYVVVVYDAAGRSICVQPDRWALTAAYFTVTETGVAISNRAAAVASLVGAGIDGDSLLSLMRGTHMPFGRSLFSKVTRVMCGCALRVDVDAAHLDHSRIWPIYVPTSGMTFQGATELLEETSTTIATRLLGSKATLFDLTGGNDTRLMAAAVAHACAGGVDGKPAWRVAGPQDHPDVELATKIAKLFDWPIIRLDTSLPAHVSDQEMAHAAAYADGTSLVDAAIIRIRQEVGLEGKWDWLVGSIGGELLRGFFWRHEMLSLKRTDDVDYSALLAYRLYAGRDLDSRWFGKGGPSLEDHDQILLAPYRQIGELGLDRLKPYKLDVMYLHKLCYGAGNTQSWLLGLQSARVALVSWEWTRMALSIPWTFRSGRSLVLHAVRALSPELTNVPNDKGEPMAPMAIKNISDYAKTGLVSGFRLVPRVLHRYTGLWGSSNGTPVAGPPEEWVELVRRAEYLSDFLDSDCIMELCRSVMSPQATGRQVKVLYALLTVELIFRQVPNLSRRVTFTAGPTILP